MANKVEPVVSTDAERKPQAVFEYRNPAFGATVLCDAETSFVEQFVALDDFILPFGGWIAMTDNDTGKAYLGVWGKRNAKRFRRMLRDRGAHFLLVRDDQPGRRPLRSMTYPAAYHEHRISRKLDRRLHEDPARDRYTALRNLRRWGTPPGTQARPVYENGT